MKKLLFLILLSNFQFTFGQSPSYQPFPDSSAFWNDESLYYDFNTTIPATIRTNLFHSIEGDTSIGDIDYRKVYAAGSQTSDFPPSFTPIERHYEGAIRNDVSKKMIYYVPYWSDQPEILYDFNLSVGDTIKTSNYQNGNWVIGIDSILIDSKYHKRFLLDGYGTFQNPDTNYALIEGIGSTKGLFYQMHPDFEGGTNLICFKSDSKTYSKDNNECLYSVSIQKTGKNKQLICYPNPASQYLIIKTDFLDPTALVTLRNSLGQVVYQENKYPISGRIFIELEPFNSGAYTVEVQTKKEHLINTLLVVK